MQLEWVQFGRACVVISFQFSTFVSLMQPLSCIDIPRIVVISFQFSTFVSLMQPSSDDEEDDECCD